MAKQSKSPQPVPKCCPGGNSEGGRFVSRDLRSVNPRKQQFEPTPAEPVRQKFKMAGGC